MVKTNKILFLNQMAGPLFRELAEDLSLEMPKKSLLYTGHPDTIIRGSSTSKLEIFNAPAYNRKSKLNRLFSWIKYSLFVFFKMLRVDSNTIIFVASNPPFLSFFAFLVNFLKKTPYIVLIYDMHLDIFISSGLLRNNTFFVKLWRLMNKKIWNRSIAVYTIGTVMAENLSKQFNVKYTKLGRVGVINPWANTNIIKPLSKNNNPLSIEFEQKDKITILYSGNMGMTHDIESILQASRILKDQKKISFLLIGEGEKWQKAYNFQKINKLNNLKILPFQPENKLPFTMSLADIALVSLDVGAETFMIPSKMFYYMSAGAAVVAICRGKNDVSEIIKRSNCGYVVEPNKPKKLASVINELSNDKKKLQIFKKNSRQSSISIYSREVCTRKFNRELLSIIYSK